MLRKIAVRIACVSAVVASGLVIGSVARADDQEGAGAGQSKKHSEEMAKGKTHDQASEATKTGTAKGTSQSKKHSEEMAKGKTHDQASEATKSKTDAAKTNKHAEEMGKGKTHDQASEATRSK